MKKYDDRRRGFTLLELLVVIAIITLLMAILMPALRATRKQAKTVACRSNLRQWAAIFMMYTADNNERFSHDRVYPRDNANTTGVGAEETVYYSEHGWVITLYPYYRNEEILCCPEACRPPPGRQGEREDERDMFSTWGLYISYPDEYIYGSYGFNSHLYGTRAYRKGGDHVPVFLDCYWLEGFPDHVDEPPPYRDCICLGDSAHYMRRFCVDRHHEASNGLLMDYSVRKVGLKELWELRWYPDWFVNYHGFFDPYPPNPWPDWMKDFRDYSPYAPKR